MTRNIDMKNRIAMQLDDRLLKELLDAASEFNFRIATMPDKHSLLPNGEDYRSSPEYIRSSTAIAIARLEYALAYADVFPPQIDIDGAAYVYASAARHASAVLQDLLREDINPIAGSVEKPDLAADSPVLGGE